MNPVAARLQELPYLFWPASEIWSTLCSARRGILACAPSPQEPLCDGGTRPASPGPPLPLRESRLCPRLSRVARSSGPRTRTATAIAIPSPSGGNCHRRPRFPSGRYPRAVFDIARPCADVPCERRRLLRAQRDGVLVSRLSRPCRAALLSAPERYDCALLVAPRRRHESGGESMHGEFPMSASSSVACRDSP